MRVAVATVVLLLIAAAARLTDGGPMTARDADVRPLVLQAALQACVQDASISSYLMAYKELSR